MPIKAKMQASWQRRQQKYVAVSRISILAARTLGLDCGPMSGFNKDKINEAFFAGTSLRANMLLNLGYDAEALYERGARLSFDEACQIL